MIPIHYEHDCNGGNSGGGKVMRNETPPGIPDAGGGISEQDIMSEIKLYMWSENENLPPKELLFRLR